MTGNIPIENATVSGNQDIEKGKEEEGFDLDEETLQIIGEEPPKSDKELEIHGSLTSRWQPWLQEGLKKEVKDALLLKYPRAGNCVSNPHLLTKNLAR